MDALTKWARFCAKEKVFFLPGVTVLAGFQPLCLLAWYLHAVYRLHTRMWQLGMSRDLPKKHFIHVRSLAIVL